MYTKDFPRFLLILINRIYDASNSQELLSLIHKGLKEHCKLGPVAALIPYDPEIGQYQMEGFASLPVTEGAEEQSFLSRWIEDWLVYYSKVDPLSKGILANSDQKALRYTDFLTRDDHLHSLFYKDFLSKFGVTWVLALPLYYLNNYLGMIWLTRADKEKEFEDLECEIGMIVSHHAGITLQLLNWRSHPPMDADLGILVIDDNDQIIFQNGNAKRLLNELGKRWTLNEQWEKEPIGYLHSNHGTFKTWTIFLHPSDQSLPLPFNGHPGRAILTEPYPPRIHSSHRMKELDLSKRQSQIVLEIMHGKTNKEIANDLSLSSQTVKDHLHDIFQHLEVRNRSELIIKVLGRIPPRNRPF